MHAASDATFAMNLNLCALLSPQAYPLLTSNAGAGAAPTAGELDAAREGNVELLLVWRPNGLCRKISVPVTQGANMSGTRAAIAQ